jgi:hypothetical protein
VLADRFGNGILVSSGIELDRFRSFAAGAEGLAGLAGLSNDELRGAIEACGTYFEGKVYAISGRVKAQLAAKVREYFDAGAQIIFYDEFYEKNRSWLFRSSVASPGMLKEILEELSLAQYYKPEYFGRTHAPVPVAVGEEILRVWGDGALATYGQLAERLAYVPLDRIKYALAHSKDFICDSPETYTHYGKVSISLEDSDAIRARAAADCDDEGKGYVSFAELPMGDIEVLNPGLSTQALHGAIYRKCLSDGFARRGKIVTHEDSALDLLRIMKGHFGTVERCTVGELEDYCLDLIGSVPDKNTILSTGHEVLVRTDRDNFVADGSLNFDIGAIDDAIDQFVPGDYLPLKDFTTFGAFPDCGRPWGLFLLESYCRRFSERYRFDCRSANSRNAGAVIRRSCRMTTYMEIMADAVAKAGVALRPNDVNRFLYDHGYIGKSTTSGAGDVIEMAKALVRAEGGGAEEIYGPVDQESGVVGAGGSGRDTAIVAGIWGHGGQGRPSRIRVRSRAAAVPESVEALKARLRAAERCTLDELLEHWSELAGLETVTNKVYALEAASAVMVRIDRDNYVTDKFLGFDPAVIDEVIGQFVLGDYLPLKGFTTFGAFPHCGRPWNLYLLESYCRRFSQMFRFDCKTANSMNAGAVIRKSCRMAYTEIMADAVLGAGVVLRPNDVNGFLYERGYIGRSTALNASEVIESARSLRGRG